MSDQSRSLSKSILTNIALVRSNLGVHKYVLIKVTSRDESPTADRAADSRFMLDLVIHQLTGSGKRFSALVTRVSLNMSHQVILKLGLADELLEAEFAVIELGVIIGIELFLMMPLVSLDVLHCLAAISADLIGAHVHLADVQHKILLELVTLVAIIAYEFGFHVAVHANKVGL